MKSATPLFAASPLAAGAVAILLIDPGLSELKNFAPTIVIVFLAVWTVIKVAPTWKEVKLREMDIREKEIAQREQQSIAIQSLADVTERIAVEQKHATEALRIAERVTMREGEKLGEALHEVMERLVIVETQSQATKATTEARG